jgi:hypothetical protein
MLFRKSLDKQKKHKKRYDSLHILYQYWDVCKTSAGGDQRIEVLE